MSDEANIKSQHRILEAYVSKGALAKELGVSTRTIDRWHALRQAPPRVVIGRTTLYNLESARRWLQSLEITGAVRRRA